ncbi:MAG: dihydroorotate dehydrogenase [Spirochaetales bacterium]|nr:dihydroorotate dehydrogenase [Spirochaetales bacterium]
MDLKVTIAGSVMQNPVGVASGTFGYGQEFEGLCDLNALGAIYTKAVTAKPRKGNDPPRLAETPAGMLNSIGLANVGVDEFITCKLPYLTALKTATIVNVAGSEEKDYLEVVEKLDGQKGTWGFEINLSCPNVREGCMTVGTNAAMVEGFTRNLRKLTSKPLIIKLTPNVTDIASIAVAAEQAGADAISCINTLVGMIINTKTKKPVLAAKTGGLSGPAILPVGIACVYKVSRAVKIPVIGIGGITSANDAIQYLLAGASAIQIGTANFTNTHSAEEVLAGIQQYMSAEKLATISDFHSFID